jgi:hypothetical protein
MATTLSTPFRYQITIRNVVYGADNLKLLSEIYCLARDVSGEGNTKFLPVNVREDGRNIGHISYNGRIWDQPIAEGYLWVGGCCDNSKLLFDNREVA